MKKEDLYPTKREETISKAIEIAKVGFPIIFPVAGTIASFIIDQVPKAREKRLLQFLEDVFAITEKHSISLDKIDDRIANNQEQLEYIVEKVVSMARPEKINIFASIFVNELQGYSLNEATKEYLLNIIETKLTTLHIRILSFMYHPNEYLNANRITIESVVGGFGQMFKIVFPDINMDILKSAYKDLYDQGFINTDVTIFGTMTSGSGVPLLENRVTDFGRLLIDYCIVR